MPSSLEPLQRLRLHWPEAQQTFLLNAKRSWGTSADQFSACLPPVVAVPPSPFFSLFGVKCRDSGSCSYCYKAARHRITPKPGFSGHRL